MKFVLALVALWLCCQDSARAQSSCSSDGQSTPVALAEHFINADCETCWSAPPTTRPGPRTMTIDWIVPGSRGDEAPLSAAAIEDARMRLDSLRRAAPAASSLIVTKVGRSQATRLRVAQGPPFNGYIGASIALETNVKIRPHEQLSAWLVLVETLPAGTDGAQAEKNLARNALVSTWTRPDRRSAARLHAFREMRPLNIPSGARPERLRVLGWVQDARGRVLTAAQSACASS